MHKIETTLQNVVEDIRTFYKPKAWHFLTLNAIDLGEEKLELQWIFSEYGKQDSITIYYLTCKYDDDVPSIVSIIPSAYLGEREVVDMFGIAIENAASGLYLDPDSKKAPLKGES